MGERGAVQWSAALLCACGGERIGEQRRERASLRTALNFLKLSNRSLP